jgi:hypothetical protein
MTSHPEHHSLMNRVAGWWRGQRQRRAAMNELEGCGREIDEIARDIGISAADLRRLAASTPGGVDLLRERMAARRLDPETVARLEPNVMRDLERVCALCGSKRQCERDLAVDAHDSRWRAYCPNVQTLDALAEEAAEDRLRRVLSRRRRSSVA